MTTLIKRDLTDAVERLGWSQTFKHLADMARAEGKDGLAGTMRLLADTMDGVEVVGRDLPEEGCWEPPFGETD